MPWIRWQCSSTKQASPKRFEAQKEFVARLIREGKDASSANALLYELSKALSEMRAKTKTSFAA